MSGTLSERRDVATAPVSGGPDATSSPTPAPTESVIVDPLSVDPQSLVHLSLWKRAFEAAEREFERDDTPARLQDTLPPPGQANARDRKRDRKDEG